MLFVVKRIAKTTKNDLIESVASHNNLARETAEGVVHAVLDGIGAALRRGENVSIYGFGTFVVVTDKVRICRSPTTGERVEVGAKRRVGFHTSKTLKDVLKESRTALVH